MKCVKFSYCYFRQSSTPSSPKYTKRTNRREVVASFGNTKSVQSWGAVDHGTAVQMEVQCANQQFQYMFQKMQDRAQGLKCS